MKFAEAVEIWEPKGTAPRWMAVVNGYQIGGNIDASGAGDATYPTEAEALAAARESISPVRSDG